MAKDYFKHPLNTLAGTLNIEAVKEVVSEINKYLSNESVSKSTEKLVLAKFFAHPLTRRSLC